MNDRQRTTTPRRLWPAVAVWVLVWAVCGILAPSVQDATGLSADVLALVMLAPAIASLVVRLTVRDGLSGAWPAAAPAGPALSIVSAIVWVAVFTCGFVLTGAELDATGLTVAGTPLLVVLLAQTVGALGEEIGWRGTLQRIGEATAPRWAVAAILGAVFGATHIGYWSEGPGFVAGFTLAVVAMALAAVLLARGSFAQRMIPATLIHLGANLAIAAGGGVRDAWLLVLPMAAATGIALTLDRLAARTFAIAADTPSSAPGLRSASREGCTS